MRILLYSYNGSEYGLKWPHDVMNVIATFAQRQQRPIGTIIEELDMGCTIEISIHFTTGRAGFVETIRWRP